MDPSCKSPSPVIQIVLQSFFNFLEAYEYPAAIGSPCPKEPVLARINLEALEQVCPWKPLGIWQYLLVSSFSIPKVSKREYKPKEEWPLLKIIFQLVVWFDVLYK